MRRSSSGWRSGSRAFRRNSGSSSMKSTPRWASVTSPGRIGFPPPRSAASEMEQWGARTGRLVTSGRPSRRPATLWIIVTSIASSSASGGRIDGRRRASMVLPEPGGPMSSTLWPPAAATSRARRACACPRTSARSPAASGAAARSASPSTVVGLRVASPRTWATASAMVSTAITGGPPASAASGAFAAGTTSPFSAARRAADAIDRAPRIAWTRPSRPSSPSTHQPSSAGSAVLPSAARIARAIGRSKAAPSLRTPAGARFTVTRFDGYSKPALRSAARIRSLASRTAPSGSPTVVVCGRPEDTSTSTATRIASIPRSAPELTRASMPSGCRARRPAAIGRTGIGLRAVGCVPEALEGGRGLRGSLERPPVAAALEEDELPADPSGEPLRKARCDVRIVAAPEDQCRPRDRGDAVLPLLADADGGAIEGKDAGLHPLVDPRCERARVVRGDARPGEAVSERLGGHARHHGFADVGRLPRLGEVVPDVLAIDRTVAAGPGADEIGTQRHHALDEQRPPVVSDEVHRLADARDLVDEPVDVGFLHRTESGGRRHAEAGEVRREHVATREARAYLVPEVMRVRDAVDEEGGHAAALHRGRPP